MKIAFYLNVLSPHQLPLAREVARIIGEENFKYIYAEDFLADRKAMGWNDGDVPTWCMKGDENTPVLIDADLVYTGIRCIGLMARRSAMGKMTAYYSERWFKPIPVSQFLIPGYVRLVCPSYWRMARQMVKLLNESKMRYLPCGPWAAKDMLRIGLKPEQIVPWGYFVKEGKPISRTEVLSDALPLRVLWVGRMINWKRVDTIICACKHVARLWRGKIVVTLVGNGVERNRLQRMSNGLPIRFLPSMPIEQIRSVMRQHDVYVLSSDAQEGWGAVVNEALEEGLKVLGTYEAGASAAMLSSNDLFHAGDWRSLAVLLERCLIGKQRGELMGQGIGEWSVEKAALRLINLFGRRK